VKILNVNTLNTKLMYNTTSTVTVTAQVARRMQRQLQISEFYQCVLLLRNGAVPPLPPPPRKLSVPAPVLGLSDYLTEQNRTLLPQAKVLMAGCQNSQHGHLCWLPIIT